MALCGKQVTGYSRVSNRKVPGGKGDDKDGRKRSKREEDGCRSCRKRTREDKKCNRKSSCFAISDSQCSENQSRRNEFAALRLKTIVDKTWHSQLWEQLC